MVPYCTIESLYPNSQRAQGDIMTSKSNPSDGILRRTALKAGTIVAGAYAMSTSGSASKTEDIDTDGANGCPETPLNGKTAQIGDLRLLSPDFEGGERMPDYVGAANANENPPLEIDDVPAGAESLVLVFDDPDVQALIGHTFDHWYVWNIDPGIGEIPRDWEGDDAIHGYNDFGGQGYDGPSPPEGTHGYRWKLFAIDVQLDLPPETRKTRVGGEMVLEAEVLASTQMIGEYDAEQGTLFE